VAQIKAQSGYDYSASWERQKQTVNWLDGEVPQPSFIDDMWNAYHWQRQVCGPRIELHGYHCGISCSAQSKKGR
jgi:hypothetical protein